MLNIGLTGGIASGKSTVAELFTELNAPVVDSDELARKVVEPGTPGLEALRQHFGDKIIAADGTLERAGLRQIVFNNDAERTFLEDTLHPRIRQLSDQLGQQYADAGHPYCLFDIPLLVETGQQHRFERVLVVDVSEQIQVTRVVARDNISEAEAMKIINTQASRIQRLDAATDILFNNVLLDALADEVSFLHQKFTDLATR